MVDEEPHSASELARHQAREGVDALEGLGHQLVILELDSVLVLDEADELEDRHRVEDSLVDESVLVRQCVWLAPPPAGPHDVPVDASRYVHLWSRPIRHYRPICQAATFRWMSEVPE